MPSAKIVAQKPGGSVRPVLSLAHAALPAGEFIVDWAGLAAREPAKHNAQAVAARGKTTLQKLSNRMELSISNQVQRAYESFAGVASVIRPGLCDPRYILTKETSLRTWVSSVMASALFPAYASHDQPTCTRPDVLFRVKEIQAGHALEFWWPLTADLAMLRRTRRANQQPVIL